MKREKKKREVDERDTLRIHGGKLSAVFLPSGWNINNVRIVLWVAEVEPLSD